MKKPLKITAIVVGSLLGLVLLALLLVSPIAKSYVQKHSKELVGREVTIKRLWVNVLGGKVKVRDLTIYEDDDTTPFFQIERFQTKVKLWDLLQHRVTVKRVLLSGMRLNIEQNRTWFNFNSMIEHFASDEPDTVPSENPYAVVINDILLEKSFLRYADLSIGSEFLLRNLSIRIPTIDLSTMKTNVGLDLCLGDSAQLHTEMHLSQNAERYTVDLQLSHLGLEIFEPYLKQSLAVDSLRGYLDLDLEAKGKVEHILDFDLSGGIALHDLSLQDSEGYHLGIIDTVYADIMRFNMNQNYIDLNRLYLSGIHSEYIIHDDESTNFDIVLGKRKVHHDTTVFERIGDTIASEFAEVQEKKELRILVEDFCLDQASFTYEDNTLPQPFHYEISDLKVDSRNFRLDGFNTVRMQAMLNEVGKMNVIWKGTLDGFDNHNLTLMLSNVKFADFSPYSIQMFGFPLEKGTLSFNSQNVVTDGKLKGINKVQIASPVVGEKVKGVTPEMNHVPLKLAFYLLTDKDNKVSLDLPISGNLEDPEFSYRKAVMHVLGNLLVKVVTAPFRLFSSDGDSQYLTFDLLQPDFTAAEYSQLDEMAVTLVDKTDVVITLEQRVNYNEVLQRLCDLQLQRDYYLSLHPEQDSMHMDLLTNEAVRSIKLTDAGLYAYAAQRGVMDKVSSKKDVEAVALALYGEHSQGFITRLIERRNALLINYLTHTKGVASSQVSIEVPDLEGMRAYEKECRYEVRVEN